MMTKSPLTTLLLLLIAGASVVKNSYASTIRGAEHRMQRELQQWGILEDEQQQQTDGDENNVTSPSIITSSISSITTKKKERNLQRDATVPGTTPGTTPGITPVPPINIVITTRWESYEGAIQGERFRISESEGLLRGAFVNTGSLRVRRIIEEENPRGDLDWDSDGSFDYYPDDDLVDTIFWTYEVCSTIDETVCVTDWFDIQVIRDPLKPDREPEAENDSYEIKEGETLRISSPGFFENDREGEPYNPLELCESVDDDGIREGRLSINGDSGGFEYRARRCWTGTEYFRYRACYEDYPDMESNEVQVDIRVEKADDRPNNPPDTFHTPTFFVDEAERLDVSSSDGLLSNVFADNNARMYIKRVEQQGNDFPGWRSLDVDRDGSFRYDSISGKKGTFTFRYEVCYEDWEDCVSCAEGTARIEVNTNPNKPGTNPIPKSQAEIHVKGGQRYRGNVFDYVAYEDATSELKATGYMKASNFKGTLNTEDDGFFEYGNSPVGAEAFSYTVCYVKWTDLCATGDITMVTKDSSINESESRNGIATLYEIYWAGQGTTGGCTAIKPSLTVYCQSAGTAAGVLTLVNSGPNNSDCRMNDMGHVNCDATLSGTIHVECRDESSRNPVRRQVVASLGSAPVSCFSAPRQTSHSIGIRSWCPNTDIPSAPPGWVGNELNWCTQTGGKATELCTETAQASGFESTIQPRDVVAQSTVDNSCIVQLGSPIPGSVTPTLERVGDNGSPSGAFPLKQCQGDCDDDNDCQGNLRCFQRDGSEVVPGCLGTGVNHDETDFCVPPVELPPSTSNANPSRTEPEELKYVGNANGKQHASYPLDNCEGDCDSDDECSPGLICHSRDSDENVPGCYGDNADLKGTDFCIPENNGK